MAYQKVVDKRTCAVNSRVLSLSFLFFINSLATVYGAICEPIRIPMCKNAMPYNVTQMPNLLHHSTQINAGLILDQYAQLVDTKCSDVLEFFLCAMFTPMCPVKFRQEVIPPCREVCLEARRGCLPVIQSYNHEWPEELDCSQLPQYDKSVCLSPDAFEKKEPSKSKEKEKKCSRRKPKSVRKIYIKNEFDFVIQATFKKQMESSDKTSVHVFYVHEVYQNKTNKISSNQRLKLWSGSEKGRAKLKEGHRYLIMGKILKIGDRNLPSYDCNTIVLRWRERWSKDIKKWNLRINKDMKKVQSLTNT